MKTVPSRQLAGIQHTRNPLQENEDEVSSNPRFKIQSYDPFLTFSNPSSSHFIDENGDPIGPLDEDTYRLFHIGREAYNLLSAGVCIQKEDQKELLDEYYDSIDLWRQMLAEIHSDGRLKLVGLGGTELARPINWDDEQCHSILSIAWQVLATAEDHEGEITARIYRTFLIHALIEIDNALIGVFMDGRGALVAAIEAYEALSNAMSIASKDKGLQEIRRKFAVSGALGKLQNDPKQREKKFVHDCWIRWQSAPNSYKSKAAFARDMLAKCEHLESSKKIEDWCRAWEKKSPPR